MKVYESFFHIGNQMRIGVAQLNPTVGDLSGNLALAIDAYEQLVGQGADLVVYPELFLCGYPPRDLLFKENFISDCCETLTLFAQQTGPVPALIGFPETESGENLKNYNSVAWCERSQIGRIFRKRLLPNYDVFDETRYFEIGTTSSLIEFKGKRIAVTICEDIWNLQDRRYAIDPLDQIAEESPDLLVNLSASPWFCGKENHRIKLLQTVVKKSNVQFAMSTQSEEMTNLFLTVILYP